MADIVLVTGGFDPLHSGHIAYLKAAKKLGTNLVVGLNSDKWLSRKKGKPFMSWEERKEILENLSFVSRVISFNDDDDTANNAIHKTLNMTHDNSIIFANGGDRNQGNTPEEKIYGKTPWVKFKWGVGGDNKLNSSSWILDNWKTDKTIRDWGYWRVLDDKQPRIGQKIKELVIKPGCSLSDQKHLHRSEHWYILEGSVQIELEYPNGQWQIQILEENTSFVIPSNTWHLTTNTGSSDAHILEVQYGNTCIESDIERRKIINEENK